jgi:EmrB/QacA subfamily drug resistance transporter
MNSVRVSRAEDGASVPDATAPPSFLATPRGLFILLLLCGAQFLVVLDETIVNTALPSIQRDLRFSLQDLQWVVSAYIITFGGFLLLGGRAADLIGRRRVFMAGLITFSLASLAGGLAGSEGVLIGARVVQGLGAAMLSPAALSIITTTFREGSERNTAMGAWGAVAGVGGAAGFVLGGVLTTEISWRWVLFVNVPLGLTAALIATRLLSGERATRVRHGFDALGAILVTGGLMLLVYALVDAPSVGWSATRTILELGGAAFLLIAFVVNETRAVDPLAPLRILRVRGLAGANVVLAVTAAGVLAMFFFLSLYMQDVLGYSPLRGGLSLLPMTGGFIVAAGVTTQLIGRVGTKPAIILGPLVAAAGLLVLSDVPADGSYAANILPGVLIVSLGGGVAFVSLITGANAGVATREAGLAAGLINTSQQIGGALGLAILSAIATTRTNSLLVSEHADRAHALTGGFQRAFLMGAGLLLVGSLLAMMSPRVRPVGQPATRLGRPDGPAVEVRHARHPVLDMLPVAVPSEHDARTS